MKQRLRLINRVADGIATKEEIEKLNQFPLLLKNVEDRKKFLNKENNVKPVKKRRIKNG